jgi:Golgi phosphoprotein 3
MKPGRPLYIYEEIMLLALSDKKGTMHMGTNYPFALGGALVAQLLLAGAIAVREEKNRKFIEPAKRVAFGDPLLDECLERIHAAKRRTTVKTWVTKFAGIKRLKERIATGLCERGILKPDQDKVLLIFTRRIYPERDPKPEREIIARMRQAIFRHTSTVDAHTAVLVALAYGTGLLRAVFDRKKLRERKQRIKQIAAGNLIGNATREVVQATQAAVMAAAAAATAATAAR